MFWFWSWSLVLGPWSLVPGPCLVPWSWSLVPGPCPQSLVCGLWSQDQDQDQDQGPKTTDQGLGTGTGDQGPGPRDQDRTRDQGPRTEDQGPGPEPEHTKPFRGACSANRCLICRGSGGFGRELVGWSHSRPAGARAQKHKKTLGFWTLSFNSL
jgi:hypothetical protein